MSVNVTISKSFDDNNNNNSSGNVTELVHSVCVTDSQCMNGGICSIRQQEHDRTIDIHVCDCPLNYVGLRCEQHNCPLNCQNDGICHSIGTNIYSCKCFGYYTGPLCTIPFVNCPNGIQCFNGGTCSTNNDDENNKKTTCHCPTTFTGPDCSIVSSSHISDNRHVDAETLLIGMITGMSIIVLLLLIYTCRHCYRKRMIEYHLVRSGCYNEGTVCSEPYNIRDVQWQKLSSSSSSTNNNVISTDKDNLELPTQQHRNPTRPQQQQQQRWKNIV